MSKRKSGSQILICICIACQSYLNASSDSGLVVLAYGIQPSKSLLDDTHAAALAHTFCSQALENNKQ